jgi:diguanylate cyclase (GGDEF)-like protein/PAS domain S-box-containing protein
MASVTSILPMVESRLRDGDLALAALAALPQTSVLVVDEDLRIVLAAGRGLAVHGLGSEQMEGRPLVEATSEPFAARLTPALLAAFDGRASALSYETLDGRRVYDIDVAPLQRDQGRRAVAVVRDVTEHRAAEAARAAAASEFRTAFDDAPIGMALVAPDGRFLRVNQALCGIVGLSAPRLRAMSFADLTHPDDREADIAAARRMLLGRRRTYQAEKRYLRADGTPVWVLLAVSLVRDDGGAPLHFIAQVQDISERKRLEGELERLATEDSLTGVWNRRAFAGRLREQLERAARHGEPAALLVLDLDGFKAVNDTLGHQAGDRLLRHVAQLLVKRLRTTDTVARLGGDEFAVLLPQTDVEQARGVVAGVEAALAGRAVRIADGADPVHARVSIGLAMVDGSRDAEAVLREADRAMYRSKAERR